MAYKIHSNAHIFHFQDGFRLFIDIANEAIRFWEEFINDPVSLKGKIDRMKL